jgi:hypothetical protein
MKKAAIPSWTGGSGVPVTVDAPGSISAHAQSLTVHFDSFTVTPPSSAGQSVTRTVAFRAAIGSDEPVHLLITHQLRGRIVKGAESRIVLTAMLGPSVLVREFPYGEPFVDDGILMEDSDDFVPAGRQPYTGIVTVLIEQREKDSPILVAVDSIDAVLAEP